MHNDLEVYRKSINLTVEIYEITRTFPKKEKFGLIDQMRRCVVSIPSNISEGYGRNSLNDLIRFLYISKGSLNELETQIEISEKLKYLSEQNGLKMKKEITEISKMLCSLIDSMIKKREESLGRKGIIREEIERYEI